MQLRDGGSSHGVSLSVVERVTGRQVVGDVMRFESLDGLVHQCLVSGGVERFALLDRHALDAEPLECLEQFITNDLDTLEQALRGDLGVVTFERAVKVVEHGQQSASHVSDLLLPGLDDVLL